MAFKGIERSTFLLCVTKGPPVNIMTIRMTVTSPTEAVENENPLRAGPLTLIGCVRQRQ